MTEIAKEYAIALFELAKEQNLQKDYRDALKGIRAVIRSADGYEELLSCPSVPMRERKGLLEKAFASSVPEQVMSFLELLCEKGHMALLHDCYREYDALYRAFSGRSVARIVSAVALTDEQKAELIAKLEKMSRHQVKAHYELDESLLGGVIIYMDDRIIDGSLRRKLREMKEELGE